MVSLKIETNRVILEKSDPGFLPFITSFLIKYEDVSKVDFYNSTKTTKRFKTVKERRELFTSHDDYIEFSRGLLEMIPCSEYQIVSQTESNVVTPSISDEEIKNSFPDYELRLDQVLSVKKCLLARRGVIQLPTATGKSSIITVTAKKLLETNPDLKVLVLAPTLSTVENINSTLLKGGLDTKVFGNPEKEIVSPVTTSTVQSLISASNNNPTLLNGVGAVFYDECLPSNSKILLPGFRQVAVSEVYERDDIQEVISFNIETMSYEVRKILRKFKTPYNDRFWKVYYKNPITGKVDGVSLTPNHKVWTFNRGYVEAQYLTVEDTIKVDFPSLRNLIVPVKVKRVTKNVGSVSQFKYNLEVEGNHNYFASNVLVSNCHHLKCDTWNRLNSLLPNVEYSLGFSALSIDKSEIFKDDIRQVSYNSSLILGSTGRVLMHMDPSYYIKRGIIAVPVVMRVSHQVVLSDSALETSWAKLSKEGLMSTTRALKIVKISEIFSKYGRKVLVLVPEKDFAFYLGDFLGKSGVKFGISFGAGRGYVSTGYDETESKTTYSSEKSLEVINKLSLGDFNVLIATSHTDEGVDINSLDACILAGGGKKDRRIVQRVGRVLRKSKSGKFAYVVDFTDSGSKTLSRQSKQRLKIYKDEIGVPDSLLYDGILVSDIETEFKKLEDLD